MGAKTNRQAAELVAICEDRGRWVGTREDEIRFNVFGTVRSLDVWAVLTEHVLQETPEHGLYARWLKLPRRPWRLEHVTAYRAAMAGPLDLLEDDPDHVYRDSVYVTFETAVALASADDVAATYSARCVM